MTKPTNRKKRSKITVALLAPILTTLFIIGWILYCIGQRSPKNEKQLQKPITKTPTKQDNIELIMIPQEEKEIIAN
jgi:hypothetical protein